MACFLVTIRLGLHDLFSHRRLALIMSLSIAIAFGMYLIVEVLTTGLSAEFKEQTPDLLLVHESQNIGEVTGSRISSQVAEMLSGMGVSMIIPEIHEVTGTSIPNATLLRGIDLEQYTHLETFTVLSGRRLRSGDPSRLAMVGLLLAKRQHLNTGDKISLRGRNFDIVGIFQNGTYMDNQAWISLADAQALLGWGQDVSVYIIPDEGILYEGEVLPGGVSVSRKGESIHFIAAQYQPVNDLLYIVSLTLAIGAALALTNILWRLAWLRRGEMAILRAIGFPTPSLAGYLLVQAGGISLFGVLLGSVFTLVITLSIQLTVSSFTIVPHLEPQTVLSSLGWICLLMLAGSLMPAWWLSHLNLAQLLHSE
jgi:putative ABC transport system permease protein